jgi:hypothetical protein
MTQEEHIATLREMAGNCPAGAVQDCGCRQGALYECHDIAVLLEALDSLRADHIEMVKERE